MSDLTGQLEELQVQYMEEHLQEMIEEQKLLNELAGKYRAAVNKKLKAKDIRATMIKITAPAMRILDFIMELQKKQTATDEEGKTDYEANGLEAVRYVWNALINALYDDVLVVLSNIFDIDVEELEAMDIMELFLMALAIFHNPKFQLFLGQSFRLKPRM